MDHHLVALHAALVRLVAGARGAARADARGRARHDLQRAVGARTGARAGRPGHVVDGVRLRAVEPDRALLAVGHPQAQRRGRLGRPDHDRAGPEAAGAGRGTARGDDDVAARRRPVRGRLQAPLDQEVGRRHRRARCASHGGRARGARRGLGGMEGRGHRLGTQPGPREHEQREGEQANRPHDAASPAAGAVALRWNNEARKRPCSLAWYIAASALPTSASGVSPSPG